MSGAAVPIPAGAGAIRSVQQPTSGSAVPIPQGAGSVPSSDIQESNDSGNSGYQINDVGNKVIIPKEGESFQDTMKRAREHGRLLIDEQGNLTPQGKEEVGKETATIPEKAAETLAGAATAGVVGPAALAAPGEIASGIQALTTPAALGLQSPLQQALPHILDFGKLLLKYGVGLGAAHAILKETMNAGK